MKFHIAKSRAYFLAAKFCPFIPRATISPSSARLSWISRLVLILRVKIPLAASVRPSCRGHFTR
ncbi:hypothetical protein CAMGR0001_2435 [Campylobacter gracilis RM3268]|uniref:Uncharacterized protein n=1 Tax=Campylobacter gracilis RM3268 TaxID=553220 RepID=C8PE85_9BACT|nr:hypothetical protein CAMGR0001_2435 [Campylobacter gracilis RM3268]